VSTVSGRSGDGFLRCSDGHVRWGRFGAAGVIFVHRGIAEGTTVLLQKRSVWAHEGGTWSCAGGAIDEGEEPFDAALREAEEEIGFLRVAHQSIGEYVFAPADDWTYTTAVVEVAERFGASLNFESEDAAWVPIADVDQRPLHAGFAAAWPHLRTIVEVSAPTVW
jgi:8-oxo-dGTP diphosphatase